MHLFGSFGPEAKQALPVLSKWVTGTNKIIRAHAQIAMRRIQPDLYPHSEFYSDLRDMILDAQLRGIALDFLVSNQSEIEPEGRFLVPALVNLFNTHPETLSSSAAILPRFRSHAAESVPLLRRLLNDPNPVLKLRTAFALWRIGKNTERVIPVVVEGIDSRQKNEQRVAVRLIESMGNEAKPVIPALARCVTDLTTPIRVYRKCLRILQELDPDTASFALLERAANEEENRERVR